MSKRKNSNIKRFSVRLPADLYSDLKVQAHHDSYSMNELIQQAAQHYLDWVHNDYDIPSLDRRRINQITDGLKSLQNTDTAKLDAIIRMISTLLAFTHGENYYSNH